MIRSPMPELLDKSTSEYHYNIFLDAGSGRSPANFTTIEDMIFEVFRNEDNNTNTDEDSSSMDHIAISEFITALENTGLRREDPRLKETMDNLEKHKRIKEENQMELTIGRKEFKNIIFENIVLISRALRHQFIIPDWPNFTSKIDSCYEKAKHNMEGNVADYISLLSREDPDKFGISICTVDGQRYSIGDSKYPFTMQSCCKPLNYGIALTELGPDIVHQYVGVEPSGQKFNDMELDTNNRPHNPFVNSGAIVINSLIQTLVKPELSLAEKFDYISCYFKRMAGDEYIGFNNSVFLAEQEISDRNYALAYYMKENKCFPKDFKLKECLDFWAQCCSMEVTCETMSVIGATLANGGVCPLNHNKVLKPDAVRDVCSLLHSCGFYESSGKFAFRIGLPGKSSVAGSMMMVLPNTMGICIYSPRLDEAGNSCRGLTFCEELINLFNFHRYDNSTQYARNKLNPRRRIQQHKGDTIVSLMYSAANGNLNELRRHMFLGHNMGVSDFDGRTPLHLAAAEGHIECAKFLISSCDVNPEPVDRWGFTPLSEADKFGHIEVVNFLRSWLGRTLEPIVS